ncbi:MAG: MgtC/SapB family protein [Pseudomonadota bacterium]
MEPGDAIIPLSVALAAGLLIGLERGWNAREATEGSRVAGVRTFALLGLLGGFVGLLATASELAVIGYGFLAVAAVLVTGYAVRGHQRGDFGVTSLIAALLTFAFGAAASQGYMLEAAMAAVATALLLGYKSLLHRWVSALEPVELRATLKLLAISVIVLPLLPDRGYGPWQVLNPFEIWWMVVLIAGISFSGYFAMRIVGPEKGALLTGLFAGLASSTALTLHFSRLARRPRGSSGTASHSLLSAGILVACGTMFPRMLVVVSIIHPALLPPLLLPALFMAGVTYAAVLLLWWRGKHATGDEAPAQLKNPLELGSALVFGVLLALILLVATALEQALGDSGLLAVAAISGVTDVDAITLALARMSQEGTALELAALGILLASAVNSLAKGALAAGIGGTTLAWRVTLPLVLAATGGLLLFWVLGGFAVRL